MKQKKTTFADDFGPAGAIFFGSLFSAICVFGVCVCFGAGGLAFFAGAGYFVFGFVGCGVYSFRVKSLIHQYNVTPRELFWTPFFPIFMAPLWIAVIMKVYGWMAYSPMLQDVIFAALILCAAASALGFFRLASSEEELANQSPEGTPGKVPSASAESDSRRPSS